MQPIRRTKIEAAVSITVSWILSLIGLLAALAALAIVIWDEAQWALVSAGNAVFFLAAGYWLRRRARIARQRSQVPA